MPTLIAVPNPAPNGDGSELTPYGAQEAIDKALPGDTILLRGVFHEVVRLAGTYDPTAPLTIDRHPDGATIDGNFDLPRPGANAKLMTAPDGTTGHYGPLVRITGKHIRWHRVDVRNSWGRGVQVSDTSDVELANFTVDWSRNSGVQLHTVERVTCRNVKNFHAGCYYQERRDPSKYNWPVAFSVLFGKNMIIDGCTSIGNFGEGFALGRGTSDSFVANSTFANNMAPNLYLHHSVRCLATRNLIYCDGSGFISSGVVVNNEDNFPDAPTVDAMLVTNNIAVGCSKNFAIWNNETLDVKSTGVRFLFNTSINATDAGFLLRTKGASAPEFIGNLVYQKNGRAVELAGQPEGYIFSRNAWLSPALPPAAVRSPGDFADVWMVDPDAEIVPGIAPDVENYRPLGRYAVGQIEDGPVVDYSERVREFWTVGALERIEDVIKPPVKEAVRLSITAQMSREDAATLRALLSGKNYTVELA